MSKAFSRADDMDINIYHQDTDSIHSKHDDVDTIVKRYKEKYNSELVGDYLGNCHVGFDMAGAKSDVCSVSKVYFFVKSVH